MSITVRLRRTHRVPEYVYVLVAEVDGQATQDDLDTVAASMDILDAAARALGV